MPKLILFGSVPSKKNNWARRQGGGMFLPAETRALIDGLILQARNQWKSGPIEKEATVRAVFFVKDGRADLDNKYTCLQDCLVKAGVLRNDSIRCVRDFKVEAIITKGQDERVEVTVF